MGAIEEKIELESDEEIPFSSSQATNKLQSFQFETSHTVLHPNKSNSWVSKRIRNGPLRSIYIVLIKAKINILLPFGPLAILLHYLTGKHGWVFFFTLLGITPLAERLGYATEQLAFYTGSTVGGLLNATFGNATEMIISIYALKNGMIRVVQQSLLGSILSNMLLVLGCAFFTGGIIHHKKVQVFNKAAALVNSGLLLMAVMGLLFPAVLHFTHTEVHFGKSELSLSRFSSCIMLVAYASYLFFQLKSQPNLYSAIDEERESNAEDSDEDEAGSSRYRSLVHRQSKSVNFNQASRLHSALKGVQNADPSVLTDGYDTYVTDSGVSVPKVLIPGLPEEPDGDSGVAISSCFWEWKPNFNVHYETSGSENINSPAVLLLPGFGVGSFHYEKQLKDLGCDYRVWAVDFLGQGMSLPVVDPTQSDGGESESGNFLWGFGDKTEPWANQLVYSIDLWQDQVRYFIEEVIKEPVYLVGNSLGGYVALYFAACNPQLVKGVTLLNATPFWGFVPNPKRSPRLSRIFPWAGTFPLPANVRKLVEIVWQKISDPTSIREILKQVYADHSTNIDKVFCRILEVTQHPAAAASLASILFAPQGELSFGDALSRCQISNVPICLIYGKEDPWVQPVWGLQVKRQLPEAPYYQISPAGHCPHDEVPEVVNYLLRGWIINLESSGSIALPLLDNLESTRQHDTTQDLEFVREGSKRSVRVRFYGSEFSLWNQISSCINTGFKDIKMKFR